MRLFVSNVCKKTPRVGLDQETTVRKLSFQIIQKFNVLSNALSADFRASGHAYKEWYCGGDCCGVDHAHDFFIEQRRMEAAVR